MEWINRVYQWTLQHPGDTVVFFLFGTFVGLAGFFWGWVRWFASNCWTLIRSQMNRAPDSKTPPPAFIWIPNQSHCVIANESTKSFTQIRTSWHVTNRSQTPLRLLSARLLKPRVKDPLPRCRINLWPRTGKGGYLIPYSSDESVAVQDTRECEILIQIDKILQRPGKQLQIVFAVTDQFDQEHRLKAVSLLVVDTRPTKTKVFRVRYFAGDLQSRTPQTPVKIVTVYLPDAVQSSALNPMDSARFFAEQVVGSEVSKDPRFSNLHFEIEISEVDLSRYAKPTLESSSGAKVWRN
jgi:hypothetical protein